MGQTETSKIADIVNELSAILSISKGQAQEMLGTAVRERQLVFSLPFSPDASLLQVETTIGLAKPSSTQEIIQVSNGKAGTSITAGTGALLHTTTPGKKFYMTSFSAWSSAIWGMEVRNGTTIAGTLAANLRGLADTLVTIQFPTPLEFDAGVFVDVGGTGAHGYCFSGWEE